ncbi:MAG TPA: hypothetical protein VK574_14055 [Terracidiphilus sp.]|jgi:hypothetical protein|nr:hypothetical protein [Terracidiphilus sp.]
MGKQKLPDAAVLGMVMGAVLFLLGFIFAFYFMHSPPFDRM